MDVSDIDRADLLATLYNHAKPQGMGFLHYKADLMTRAEAQEILDTGETYFDYHNGRVMKIEIPESGELRTDLYNMDNGPGAAEVAIQMFRDGKSPVQGS